MKHMLASSEITVLVLLFGSLLVMAIGIKGALERVGMPPLVGYLLLGLGLRLLNDTTHVLGTGGMEVIHFLARIGVAVLLFRVGFESDLGGLLRQLRSASLIWLCNVVGSAAIGYLAVPEPDTEPDHRRGDDGDQCGHSHTPLAEPQCAGQSPGRTVS